MAHYMITLVVETDPTDGNPEGWAWGETLDACTTVVACTKIADDPADSAVDMLHGYLSQAHDVVSSRFGD